LFYKSGTDDETDTTSKPIVQLQQELEREQRLIKAATIPWLQGQDSDNDNDAKKNVFLSHWNWQLDYFREHLTNLRVNEPSTTNGDDNLYCLDDGTKRMYTVSLSSDEYRDIRVTYMDFPSCQTFRCLAYPSDASLPILGMGLMKFGKHQHLAVLDYQPLTTSNININININGDSQHNRNDAFSSELLRMRAEIPTMSQPHTYRHFVTEERKYFTDYPLLGKYNNKKDKNNGSDNNNNNDDDNDGVEAWFQELQRGQRDFVETHVRLTQGYSSERPTNDDSNDGRNSGIDDDIDVVRIHSDFDTHVSRKEPAGPMLVATYGPEVAHRLVHEVIFPLSRNTHQATATATATATAEEQPVQSQQPSRSQTTEPQQQ